jgi:hypothetical protein
MEKTETMRWARRIKRVREMKSVYNFGWKMSRQRPFGT